MLGSDNKPRCPGKKIVSVYGQGNANPEILKSFLKARMKPGKN